MDGPQAGNGGDNAVRKMIVAGPVVRDAGGGSPHRAGHPAEGSVAGRLRDRGFRVGLFLGCGAHLLAAAGGVALIGYGMPVGAAVGATLNGAAFGVLPIGWILFSAILLYRLTIETGKFEIGYSKIFLIMVSIF